MANPASSCITLAKRANGAVRLKFCHYVLLIIQKDRVPQIQICHPSETDGTWSENYQKVNLSQLSQLNNKKAKQPSDVYSPAFCHREAQSIFIHSIHNYWCAGLMTSYSLENITNSRRVYLCWAATLQSYLTPDPAAATGITGISSASCSYKAQCKVQPLSFWSTGSRLSLTQEFDIFILCFKYLD